MVLDYMIQLAIRVINELDICHYILEMWQRAQALCNILCLSQKCDVRLWIKSAIGY